MGWGEGLLEGVWTVELFMELYHKGVVLLEAGGEKTARKKRTNKHNVK